jgi:hypothetical protein
MVTTVLITFSWKREYLSWHPQHFLVGENLCLIALSFQKNKRSNLRIKKYANDFGLMARALALCIGRGFESQIFLIKFLLFTFLLFRQENYFKILSFNNLN